MFFLVERTESVALAPSAFGRHLRREVEDALRAKVEGKCTGKYGFTIIVTNVESMKPGRLDEDSGYAHFEVHFLSLVFRPFKNEILLAKVHTITNNGFFASAGPIDIFVSQYGLPADLVFDACGSNGTPMLHSAEEDVRIEIGTEVRIKLQGVRMSADNITVLGTIKEDFLG